MNNDVLLAVVTTAIDVIGCCRFPQDTVEQACAARVVLRAAVGKMARAHVAPEVVRRLDQER